MILICINLCSKLDLLATGNAESKVISGLQSGVLYYVAIEAKDEAEIKQVFLIQPMLMLRLR